MIQQQPMPRLQATTNQRPRPSMKIIITGGSGFIGSALIQELLKDRHEIVVPSRSPDRVKSLPAGVRIVKWDARTAQGWGGEVDGADVIVNLAGEAIGPVPWIGDRKEKIRGSRVNAGQAIVEAIERATAKPRVLVQSSAIGYYGIHGAETLTEQSLAGTDFLSSVCLDWENSTSAVEKMGVRRVVYRTGLVLSRKGGFLPVIALPFRLFVGGKLGSGKQWFSWIHLEDEIAALKFLILNETARGVFNLTAPNPVRNADFARAVGKALGRPAAVPVPGFAMKLVLGEMGELLVLGGQRVAPEHLEQLGFQFRYPTIQAALQELYAR